MIIREIQHADLPEVFRWFETRKYPIPVKDRVGPEFGVVAEKDGRLVACLWAYLTGRSIAYLEFPGTNPDVENAQGYEAMDQVISHFKQMCSLSRPQISTLRYYTKNKKLAEHIRSNGFKMEEGFICLTWTLKD